MAKAKPFIKWVGGKGQLIGQLEVLLPTDFDKKDDLTYIEPFVGGGAMLFHMLQAHGNIRHAVINDINPDLIKCYETVKYYPDQLIRSLTIIQDSYYRIAGEDAKKDFYMRMRDRFNRKPADPVELTTLFVFLNRTCFNGLYRVNKAGKFNVPCGRYVHPTICDADTIKADSRLLQNVTILTGDFEQTLKYVKGDTFFYLDPPYRPLSSTSSFKEYAKETFDDKSQIRLKYFCDSLDAGNIPFMLSNSDCLSKDGTDRFFDDLFEDYQINRVWASRCINANASKRGKLTEILVRNYTNKKREIHVFEEDKLKLAL